MSEQADPMSVQNDLGHRIYVNPGDRRGEKLMASRGDANPESMALWRSALALAEWDLVLDIGSNYGEMVAGVDLSAATRVVAFEPNPQLVRPLRETLSALPWDVELVEAAIGDRSGSATLTVDDEWSGKSSLVGPRKEGGHVIEVPIMTIDEFCAESPPSRVCMKIDVEGGEMSVIDGAARTLARSRVAVMMIEILHMPVEAIAQLARNYPVFALDVVDNSLVRLWGKDRLDLGRKLHSGRLSRQDAIIVQGAEGGVLVQEIERMFPAVGVETPAAPVRVVYTALLGGYETLQEEPMALKSSIPHICLTDDPSLVSNTWDVRLVEPLFPKDPVRSARALKILGHQALGEYTESIWVDNRVSLVRPAEELFDEALGESDFTAIAHSFRDELVDEFDAVAQGGYDEPARVYEQLIHYAETSPEILSAKPLWTGLLIRRRTSACDAAMHVWFSHVLRHSRRDQLSVQVALSTTPVRQTIWQFDNRESPWHRWPPLGEELGRRRGLPSHRFQESVRAPLARLRQATSRSDEIIAAHEEAAKARNKQLAAARALLAERDRSLIDLQASLAEGQVRLASQESEARAVVRELDDAREHLAILTARANRLSRKLRVARADAAAAERARRRVLDRLRAAKSRRSVRAANYVGRIVRSATRRKP